MYTIKYANSDIEKLIKAYLENNLTLKICLDEVGVFYKNVTIEDIENINDYFLLTFSTTSLTMQDKDDNELYHLKYRIGKKSSLLDCVSVSKTSRSITLLNQEKVNYILITSRKCFQIILSENIYNTFDIVKSLLDENRSMVGIRDVFYTLKDAIDIATMPQIIISDNKGSEMIIKDGFIDTYIEYLNRGENTLRLIFDDGEVYFESIERKNVTSDFIENIKRKEK